MDFLGVVGGLIVLGCLGDEGVNREGPGWEDDFRCWSSRFLKSRSCSNFSRPGLNDLTLVGVGCLGGVLGGYFVLGDYVNLSIGWRGTGGIWLRL